jgi:hypothetical protein
MTPHAPNRTGSVYLAILVVVAAVTSLVMTGALLRRHMHDRSDAGSDGGAARRLSVSAAELAIDRAYDDEAAFKLAAKSGAVFDALQVDPGLIRAGVTDADTKAAVTDATTNYRVVAEASVGDARSRIGMLLETPDDELSLLMAGMSGAIAYWPLDEVNQAVAVEELNARHGAYALPVAAGAYSHTHGGPAPRITWMTEYVSVSHRSAFELANGTLTFWVRFDLKPTAAGQQMAAVVKERTHRNSSMSMAVYLEHDYVYYTLNNAADQGGTIRFASSKIVQGQWHFMAVTWGDQGMEIYLDGVREARNTSIIVDFGTGFPLRLANTDPWYFGVRNIPYSIYTHSNPTFGSVARVGLFNTRLSSSQILSVYQASSLPPGIRLVPGTFATVTD